MTETSYYRLAALLPLTCPFVAGSLLRAVVCESSACLSIPAMLLGPIAVSLPVAGLPYTLFAALTLWLLRRHPAEYLVRFSFYSPFVFALIMFAIAIAIPGYVAEDERTPVAIMLGIAAIVLGEAYLFAAHAGFELLHWFGVVEPRPGAPRWRRSLGLALLLGLTFVVVWSAVEHVVTDRGWMDVSPG